MCIKEKKRDEGRKNVLALAGLELLYLQHGRNALQLLLHLFTVRKTNSVLTITFLLFFNQHLYSDFLTSAPTQSIIGKYLLGLLKSLDKPHQTAFARW